MQIKLISPRMSLRPMDSEFKRLMAPSLALLVLGSLTPKEYSIVLEDENAGRINFNDNPDLVGITVNVDSAPNAYKIASAYRKKGVPVILGGIHVSANPAEAALYADAICIGEAEHLWDTILKDAVCGHLKKQYYYDGVTDVSKTPVPCWELVKKSNYLYTNVMCTSRGCPFKCEFCYNSCKYVQGGYRNRPIDTILKEIELMGTKQVMFIDDNFIGNIDRTKKLLSAIEPLNLTWHAAVSANIHKHPELLDQMERTGCRSLFIGFESINTNSLKSANKHQNKIEEYDELIESIHCRGIMINASMVFGLDHDSPSVFDDTLNWLVKNKVETVTSHILTPYPGTQIYRRMDEAGRIFDKQWDHYNTAHVVFEPKYMTKEQLYDGYIDFYKRFYSFENIIKRMPKSKRVRMPYLLFNFGYRKFGKATSILGKIGLMRGVGTAARKLAYGV